MRNYVGYGKANNFAIINLLSRYVYVQKHLIKYLV